MSVLALSLSSPHHLKSSSPCAVHDNLASPGQVKVSCKKVIMPKEGLQLGCPFFLLLLEQQRESKGHCKILLPRDMQVLCESMQLKKL